MPDPEPGGRGAGPRVPLVDGHAHLFAPGAGGGVFKALPRNLVAGEVLNGTAPDDWDAVAAAAAGHDGVRGALGIHPWRLEEFQSDWLARLEAALLENPTLNVGEIGLDAAWAPREHQRADEFAALQKRVFEAQMEVAARLRRAVSVHCVRSFAVLVNVLLQAAKSTAENALPTRILLHSWAGSPETLRQLLANPRLRDRILVGVSAHVNARPLFRYSLLPDDGDDSAKAQCWTLVDGINALWKLDSKAPPAWVLKGDGATISHAPWREASPKAWAKFRARVAAARSRIVLETDLSARSSPRIRAASLMLVAQLVSDACDVGVETLYEKGIVFTMN